MTEVDNSPIINRAKRKTGEIAHRNFSFFRQPCNITFVKAWVYVYAEPFQHKITFAPKKSAVAGRKSLTSGDAMPRQKRCPLALHIPVHFPFQPTSHLLYLFYSPFNSCPLPVPAHFPFAVLIYLPNIPVGITPFPAHFLFIALIYSHLCIHIKFIFIIHL